MTQQSFIKKALLLSGVALFAFAAPAEAGFEWKGPLETPHAAASASGVPSMPAAPATPVDSQSMNSMPAGATPMDSMDSMAPVTDPSAMNNAPAQSDNAPVNMGSWSKDAQSQAAAMPAADKPAAPQPLMAPQNNDAAMNAAMPPMDNAPAGNGAPVLSGFGSDLPLVIALQQIVPPGYQYSFTSGVNPGTTVSWEGGKPWQQVLGDTLQKQNLGYRVQNNTVVIGTFGNARSPDSTSGMNDAPAMAAPVTNTAANTAPAPQAAHDADMPAPLWDAPAADNNSANNAPVAAPVSAPEAAPQVAKSAPVRTPIISPSTSANRASRLPADLGGYAANANDGSSANSAPQNTPMDSDANNSMAATNNAMEAAPAPAATPATDTAAAATDADGKPKTVVIHRQKPSSLFQRLGMAKSPNRDQRNADDLSAANMPAAPATGSAAEAASGDNLVLPPPSTATENVSASANGNTNSSMNSQPERVASAASPQSLSMNDASPAATPVSAATAGANGGWAGARGASLHEVLSSWSNRAGVKLYWSIDYDYKLPTAASYTGAYDEAVGDLLGRFSSVRPQPYGQQPQSADGSRVLVVKSYDLSH